MFQESSVYDAGVFERRLDRIVNRNVVAVEGFVAELREAADEGLELRHHILRRLLPFSFLRLDSIYPCGIIKELRGEVNTIKISVKDSKII